MTIGIYSINCGEENKFYIGQSNNVDNRFNSHKTALDKNKHSNYKLQTAYNKTKIFIFNILQICELNELNKLEELYIIKYNSIISGYNIILGSFGGSGTNHSCSKYNKEQLIEVFNMCLNPDMLYKDIENLTGVKVDTIRDIATGRSHIWLHKLYPEKSNILKTLVISKIRKCRGSTRRKFNKLKSPEGIIYPIHNVTSFAVKHKLNRQIISDLLIGKRVSNLGWTGV